MSKKPEVGLLSHNADEEQSLLAEREGFTRIITVRAQALGTLRSNCLPESLSPEGSEGCRGPCDKSLTLCCR